MGASRIVPISEVYEINPSFHRDGIAEDTSVSFIPMAAINETSGMIAVMEERPLQDVVKNFTPFLEGDVLFAKITPCMENGKVVIARDLKNGIGFGSTEFHVFRPKGDVISEWLFYFMRRVSFRKAAEQNMTGSAGQKRVPRQFFDRALIPVPPKQIQNKVVTILSKVEATLEKRRQAIRLLDEFLKSTFLEMFGDPIRNSKKWQTLKVSEFCETTSGGTPDRTRPEYFDGGIPWIKSGELKNGYVLSTEETLSEIGFRNSSAKRLPTDTILIAMYGATVGEVGLLKINGATTNQAVAAVIPDPKKADFLYLFHFFQKVANYLIAKRVGGGQPNISQKIIRELKVSLPPLAMQKEFSSIVKHIEDMRQK